MAIGGHSTTNIFDRYIQQAQTQGDMARYGVQPHQGEELYNQLGAQQNTTGLGAQTAALDMYRQQALGQRPSVAGLQAQQSAMMAARGQAQAGGMTRGGNAAGAYQQATAAGAGLQNQVGTQGAYSRAAEQQAAMAGYAGLGSQLYSQGMAYDQLAEQQRVAANQQALDRYLGTRSLDLQQTAANRQFALGMIQQGMGAAGGIMGAVSKIGGG